MTITESATRVSPTGLCSGGSPSPRSFITASYVTYSEIGYSDATSHSDRGGDVAMYMRVARSRVDPARLGEVSQVGQDVVTAISRQPGCQNVLAGLDRGTGQWIIVSTWDTEEHARFSREALGEVMSRVQSSGGQVDLPEFFEVITQ